MSSGPVDSLSTLDNVLWLTHPDPMLREYKICVFRNIYTDAFYRLRHLASYSTQFYRLEAIRAGSSLDYILHNSLKSSDTVGVAYTYNSLEDAMAAIAVCICTP